MSEQLNMFGPPMPAQSNADLSPHQKAELLLEQFPETREDDRLLMLKWWASFDNLDAVFRWTLSDLLEGEVGGEELAAMAEALSGRFQEWFMRTATHPETIRRRRQDIQSNRKDLGALRGSASTTAYRKARDGAGPPRR